MGNITIPQTAEGVDTPFAPLAKVQCVSASDTKMRKRNMRWCMVPGKFKRVQELVLPEIGTRQDIAIIGGGPTLNDTYKEAMKYEHIMTCGSSHDHAVKLGIKPTFHIECDPSWHQVKNYREQPEGTKYLVSSRCSKSMFDRLKGRDIYLWHMWEGDLGKPVYRGEPAFVCGATVVLSAIPVALTLGWKHLHFFGFDSSFPSETEHHAYEQAETAAMLTVKVGDPVNGRDFKTTATWAGQVQQFEDMRNHWPFECTVYGDSLTAEVERIRKIEIANKRKAA